MSATADTAKNLMTFLAGPPVLGTAALFAYVGKVMSSKDRTPAKGWRVVAAGTALAIWFALFLIMAMPTVWHSWFASGDLDPLLAGLSGAGVLAIGCLIFLFTQVGRVAQYLSDSYHRDEGPWYIELLRKIFNK